MTMNTYSNLERLKFIFHIVDSTYNASDLFNYAILVLVVCAEVLNKLQQTNIEPTSSLFF
jgi:hypothetical protein